MIMIIRFFTSKASRYFFKHDEYFQPQRVLIKNQHTSTQMIAIKYLDRDLCSTLPRTLPLNAEHQ